MSHRLLVVAGEVSGDLHAGGVVEALRTRQPELEVFGIGGDRLAAAGAELLVHIREMAVFGPFAALAKYPFFRKVMATLVQEAEERRPDAVLLVDYGGFNLRFAAQMRKRGIRVLYYVSPQVWASRRGRIKKMAQVIDRLMVIFPFEPAVFEGTGLRVDYVGHPLVDEAAAARERPVQALPWDGAPHIALLPGSRRQEVTRILPVLLGAARMVERVHPDCSFLIAAPNAEIGELVREGVREVGPPPARWAVVTGETREVLRQARAAVVASGTATVETALMGCPMVVVYATSNLMYALAKRLVKVPYIGMVNLIAGREIAPELIQDAATPEAIFRALDPLLRDTEERRRQLDGLREVCGALGDGGASRRVADIVMASLGNPRPAHPDEGPADKSCGGRGI